MNFNTEASYKAYFEALATSHNDIDAFIFGDDDVINTSQRSGANNGITLWLDYYRPITVVGTGDNFIGNIVADFVVMKPINDIDLTTAQQQAVYKECEDIAQQIFARINYDFQTNVLENEPQWNSAQFGRMENHHKAGSMYAGATAEMAFHYPVDFQYDQTKWS